MLWPISAASEPDRSGPPHSSPGLQPRHRPFADYPAPIVEDYRDANVVLGFIFGVGVDVCDVDFATQPAGRRLNLGQGPVAQPTTFPRQEDDLPPRH